jgi:signal transduction histidine kinase
VRRERLDRWVREHPVAIDAVLVFGLLIFPGIASVFVGPASPWILFLSTVLLTVPLAWRRTQPALSTSLVYAAAFTHFIAGTPLLPSDLTVFVALYSVAAYGSRRVSRLGLGFAMLGVAMVTGYASRSEPTGAVLLDAIIIGIMGGGFVFAVWVTGSLRGTRRAYLEAVVDRAHQLEVEREQQAQLAAAAERARIARELHDVVAHSLSVVIAQADGGRYAAQANPAAAVEALEVISSTGRTALTDMRRLLGVLRDGEGPQHGPQPGFDAIGDLVASVRASGLPVGYTTVGHPRPVGDAMGLAAYRIVQEALTNVLKHAGPAARADIRITWETAAVRLVIDDDGRGASATTDGRGQGLGGMRERAALYGGSVTAAPRPGGGYRVQAVLPYPGGGPVSAPGTAQFPAPRPGAAWRQTPAPGGQAGPEPGPAAGDPWALTQPVGPAPGISDEQRRDERREVR